MGHEHEYTQEEIELIRLAIPPCSRDDCAALRAELQQAQANLQDALVALATARDVAAEAYEERDAAIEQKLVAQMYVAIGIAVNMPLRKRAEAAEAEVEDWRHEHAL